MRRILTVLTAAILLQSPLARSEGHGVGTGDGFPTGDYEQERIRKVPAKSELQALLKAIGLEFPTLAHRFVGLIESFERDLDYELIHVKTSYPSAMADSQRTDSQTDRGIPRGARILYFDEFAQATPGKQAEVLLHEFVHLLLTAKNETATQELTTSLLAVAAGTLNPPTGVAVSFARQPRFVEIQESEFEAVTQTYSSYLGQEACSEIAWKPLGQGEGKLDVPRAPQGFAARLTNDVFFARYREHCLAGRLEGRMILQGFTQHPVWHAQLLRSLLELKEGEPLVIRLAPSSDTGSLPYLKNLPKKIEKRFPDHRISESQLGTWIPGYKRWKRIRAHWFAPSELAPQPYAVGDVIRFPLQWIGMGFTNIPLNSKSWKIWPVRFDAGSGATGQCTLKKEALHCVYRVDRWWWTDKTVRREWPLTLDWAMQSFLRSSPLSYSAWPALVLE